jgi:leucyl-tRNA synthetase
MFLGPIEQSKPWDVAGIDGCFRFLKKFWNLFWDKDTFAATDGEPTKGELKVLHKLIKKVTEDIETFSYNTSIPAFMIATNELAQLHCRKRAVLEPVVALIAPFAPHIAEELWHALGNNSSVCDAAWPQFDASALVEDTVKMMVAFNGKTRFGIDFPAGTDNATIEATVRGHEQTPKYLDGKQIVKVIIVPGRMVNLVVK